jgi:hypothetical protein
MTTENEGGGSSRIDEVNIDARRFGRAGSWLREWPARLRGVQAGLKASRAAAEHISELETKSHEHIRYGDWPRCGGLHDRSQLPAA